MISLNLKEQCEVCAFTLKLCLQSFITSELFCHHLPAKIHRHHSKHFSHAVVKAGVRTHTAASAADSVSHLLVFVKYELCVSVT